MRGRIAGLGICAAAGLVLAATTLTAGPAQRWSLSVPVTNQVASSPTTGGGYPDVGDAPVPGTCRAGTFNANHSESWIAVKPGTEDLVGASKFFFETFSTFYNFYNGSYTILGGRPSGNAIVQGYDCTTVGTQAMPPSWTNTTDPNVEFDTKGRAYQVMLPFNAYWVNLHPNAAITLSYSDDMGRTWHTGNGGQPLEQSPSATAKQAGHVEDKQWVAVNHIPRHPFQDHVYAMWSIFNGGSAKIVSAVSRDRGASFAKAQTISVPSEISSSTTYVVPTVGAGGVLYASVVSFPTNGGPSSIYVTRSRDDGVTFDPWVRVASVGVFPGASLPNIRARDGIVESFVASPTHPGHLYVTWEDWDGAQFDVKLAHSLDGGRTWSQAKTVNDDVSTPPTDQFQPQVAAGPGGAVAVAFYDRRASCPDDPAVVPANRGRRNVCIDTSLQVYRDAGAGPVKVGANVRISHHTWDPEQPTQTVGGVGQAACPTHDDPCTVTFIGDYFGLAISARNVYALMTSTHYPSTVAADGGGPVYYQQQVLATVARSALGI